MTSKIPYNNSQIQMNVLRVSVVVLRYVRILTVATSAPVNLDMTWQKMSLVVVVKMI